MRSLVLPALFLFATACHYHNSKSDPQPGIPPEVEASMQGSGSGGDGAKKSGGDAEALEKELKQKQRDLGYAQVEQQTTALSRQVRDLSVAAALDKAKFEVDKAARALEWFTKEQKPRELEQKRISLDAQKSGAEAAKDEFAELESMYEEDEFASKTKELVLKRGRNQMELAARRLAVTEREFTELETRTMVDREKDLQRALADAERGLRTAQLEAEKAKLELDLAAAKAQDRVADLEKEIAELQKKLQKAMDDKDAAQ